MLDKEEKLEKALTLWSDRAKDIEIQVNRVIKGETHKKNLNSIMSDCKLKFRQLENVLKIY